MRLLCIFIFMFSMVAKAEDVSSAASAEKIEVASGNAVVPSDARSEDEIPLNLESKKNANTEGGGLFRILFTISLMGLLGTGAFVFIRKYSIPKDKKHQTQIKVLQQHYLGPKKSLAIVRVAGESILIGVTDHNISMIKSLSLLDDEVPAETPQSFEKVLQEDVVEREEPSRKVSKALDPDEEFAISGIKDIVSKRLKGMRSFQ